MQPDHRRRHLGGMAVCLEAQWPVVEALLRSVDTQLGVEGAALSMSYMVAMLEKLLPAAFEHLEAAIEEVLTFAHCPKELWKRIWSTCPKELVDKEIRRGTDVVDVFRTVIW